jgi:arsenite-transporting ATPase
VTRVVLVSGKGGVGKTTVAAATATLAAAQGQRALVLSLDRAHNLGDVLGEALGPDPARVAGGFWAVEADPQAELRRAWDALSGYLARLLEHLGLGGVEADEVAIFPGLEELLLLSRLTELVESSDYDVVVVDLAPTASSLRLLGFPELMAGAFGKLVQWDRRVLRLLRPAMKRALKMPVPEDDAYAALDLLAARLARLKALLTDPARTVVRLVSIPERVVVEETRSAFTLLSLFGLSVDAVVLNRVLPDELARGYLAAWTRIQARERARAGELFADVPILELRFQATEVSGHAALTRVAHEIYGDRDPSRPFRVEPPLRLRRERGRTRIELRLPHAAAGSVDLKQRGDELILTIGGWRRRLALPASLRGQAVSSAKLAHGMLTIQLDKEPT